MKTISGQWNEAPGAVTLIDAHHHLWDLKANRYPFLSDQPEPHFFLGDYDAIRRNYLPEDYLRDSQAHNVLTTVHCEAEMDRSRQVAETQWLTEVNARYGFPGAITSNDLDLLLGVGKTFLADFYQFHSFLVADDQIFEWQFTRLHLLDNFLEPIHRALKVRFRLAWLRFTTHGENGGIKHTFARKKGRVAEGTKWKRCHSERSRGIPWHSFEVTSRDVSTSLDMTEI